MDAFTLNLTELKAYANPPWNLIGRVLAQTRLQQAELVLVAPVWKARDGIPSASKDAGGNPPPDSPKEGSDHSHTRSTISGTTRSARFLRELQNCSWRHVRQKSPVSCPIGKVINFLAHLYEQGYHYRSINSYQSAISSMHEKVHGYEVGQHPMVSRLVKGIFHDRPPQPRYCETWDVSNVTSYIESRVRMILYHSQILLTRQ